MITAEEATKEARAIKSICIDFANDTSILFKGLSSTTASLEILNDGSCNLYIQGLRWTRKEALDCIDNFAKRGHGLLSKEVVEKLLSNEKGE